MREEKITLEIDENTGEIIVEVNGVKGPACVTEVEKLIGDLAMILEETKTDEYFQDVYVTEQTRAKQTNQVKGKN